ncbi:MAG: IS110 family transposase, partial [Candidatus Binatia bacterium]
MPAAGCCQYTNGTCADDSTALSCLGSGNSTGFVANGTCGVDCLPLQPTSTATSTATATATQTPPPTAAAATIPATACRELRQRRVCCDTACPGPDQSCTQPGHEGTCIGIAPAPAASPTGLLAIVLMLAAVAAAAFLAPARKIEVAAPPWRLLIGRTLPFNDGLPGRPWRPEAAELALENGPPPLIANAVEYPRPESLHTQGRWAMCAGSGDRKTILQHTGGMMGKAERMVGVDVSARSLEVSRGAADEAVATRSFANNAPGCRELARWVTQGGRRARVVLEATGLYSLDVALQLERTPGVAVMVLNPRASKEFAGAWGQRARTDATAAELLREYAARMPFTAWTPPSAAALGLRAVMRRVVVLTEWRVQERNRLHAVDATAALPAVLRRHLQQQIALLGRQIVQLEHEARALVEPEPTLRARLTRLRSIKGVGMRSALLILAELAVWPERLTARQWVAQAGLDPRPLQSGTSVHPPVRISKRGDSYLRRALFRPALVAVRHNPAVQRLAGELAARGKAPLQVLVAVMR